MRPWTEKVYGIPPEQMVGSSSKTSFEMRDGKLMIMRLPEINFIDDKAGKPIGIHQHIGGGRSRRLAIPTRPSDAAMDLRRGWTVVDMKADWWRIFRD